MPTVRTLHDEAMTWANKAMVCYHTGDILTSRQYSSKAYPLERQAAFLVPYERKSEPTRSILFLSAATLAGSCFCFEDALVLIDEGLRGWPFPKIKEELLQLKEKVTADLLVKKAKEKEKTEEIIKARSEVINFARQLLKDDKE